VAVPDDPQLLERLDRLESEVAEARKAAESSRRSAGILVFFFVFLPISLAIIGIILSAFGMMDGIP
jgi:hypothetical protein